MGLVSQQNSAEGREQRHACPGSGGVEDRAPGDFLRQHLSGSCSEGQPLRRSFPRWSFTEAQFVFCVLFSAPKGNAWVLWPLTAPVPVPVVSAIKQYLLVSVPWRLGRQLSYLSSLSPELSQYLLCVHPQSLIFNPKFTMV